MALSRSAGKKLLRLLDLKPEADVKTLAKLLKVSPAAVKEAVAKLTKQGVLHGRRYVIDWKKANIEKAFALVDVKVSPARDVGYDDVAQRIGRFPEVKFVYLVSGLYDFSILVEGKNMEEISNFIAEKLAPLDRVQSTITHFIMRKFKEDGVLMEEAKDQRLAISP